MARMVMCNATKEKGDSKDFIKIKVNIIRVKRSMIIL